MSFEKSLLPNSHLMKIFITLYGFFLKLKYETGQELQEAVVFFFVFHPITFLCLVSLCLKESFLKEPEIGWKVTKTCHTHMISDFVQEIGI